MNYAKKILISEDNDDLREQLIRLLGEFIPDWLIIEAKSFENAREQIDSNQINVLISDLYLEYNEDIINDSNHLPSGIKVAKYLRNKQPDSFIYIVSNHLSVFLTKNKLSEYIDIGVNDFLDRNVIPFEKFSQKLQYQLQKIDQSIIYFNSFPYKFWKAQDIVTYESFWILILDINERKYEDLDSLIADCTIWEKNIPEPGAAFLILDIHCPKIRYLKEGKIFSINDDNYPILLVSDSHDFKNIIKFSFRTLGIIRERSKQSKRDYFRRFLDKIHSNIKIGNSISNIKKEIQDSQFWNWLNFESDIIIKGFSLKSGSLELSKIGNSTKNYNMIIQGNYNKKIEGDYNEQSGNFGIGKMSGGEIKDNAKAAGVINEAEKKNLVDAAAEIQALLEQLSKTYPTSTYKEKTAVVGEAVDQIENNPTLKARVINALKAGGTEAFKEAVNHPLVNILMATIEGWQQE